MKEASESSSPATPKDQRRRRRWSTSITSECSFSLSTPYHRLNSPPSSSSIPFSWEHQPGVPKSGTSATAADVTPKQLLLPLPPPLRSNRAPTNAHRKKRVDTYVDYRLSVDPFTVALEECNKRTPAPPIPSDLPEFWRRSAAVRQRSVSSTSLVDRLGSFFAVHCACKQASCSVSNATTVRLPRRQRS